MLCTLNSEWNNELNTLFITIITHKTNFINADTTYKNNFKEHKDVTNKVVSQLPSKVSEWNQWLTLYKKNIPK